MDTRETIWDMIANLLPRPLDEQVVLYVGCKKWEEEVKDIVNDVEALAMMIENHINEKPERDRAEQDNLDNRI